MMVLPLSGLHVSLGVVILGGKLGICLLLGRRGRDSSGLISVTSSIAPAGERVCLWNREFGQTLVTIQA